MDGRAQRIVVYGVTGSGKSVLAARISQLTGIERVAVDEVCWRPGWVQVSAEEQRRLMRDVCGRERWVLDSAWGVWTDIALARADLVVALDYPRWVSLTRLLRRTVVRIVGRHPVCNGNTETWGQTFSRESIIAWHVRSFASKRRRIAAWEADPATPAVRRLTQHARDGRVAGEPRRVGEGRGDDLMEAFVVTSGEDRSPLHGTVRVGGAKNSALKLMAAALLAPGTTTITNLPDILDVAVMARLLEELGCTVSLDLDAERVDIDVPETLGHHAPYHLVRRLRASISVLGPLLARCGRAEVSLPGGDNIGSRGLDMHLRGLGDLGAEVGIEHGYVVASVADRLVGTPLWLDFPSVGATENLVMAATLAHGTTVVDNVAREPEIVDLCTMLVEMGARIDGIGSSTLVVDGVDRLHPVAHATVTDRIVTGTWAFATAMAGGELVVEGGVAGHLDIVLDKLVSAGAGVEVRPDGFVVSVERRLDAFDVVTLPYPGFPTDLQPFAMALAAVSDGTAMITENVFEARFMFAQELARLGADVRTDGHHAVVRGRPLLSGAEVVAHDIRAGAALVLAGLAASGRTTVADSFHIDRGYPGFVETLRRLGVDVERVELPDYDR